MATLLFVIGLLITLFAGVSAYGALSDGYVDPDLLAARFIAKAALFFYFAAAVGKYIGF